MNFFDILLAKKEAGGGDAVLKQKTVTQNGTYNASSDSADGYSKVTVSVPASAVDSGTKSITANGNNQDVIGYAAVDVAVPNTYAAGDEGKVVSGGALVAQTSDTVTQNGTVDTTLINSLTVNVSGGGGGAVQAANILDGTTLTPGYLTNSGGVSSQSATSREITTDYIDISAHLGDTIYFSAVTDRGQPWAAACFYDSSKAFVGSRIAYSSTETNHYGINTAFTVPSSGVKYVRISTRTYGNAAFAASYSPLYTPMSSDGWVSYNYA